MVLPSGCTVVEIDLNESGTVVRVSTQWPSKMAEVDTMFAEELKSKAMMPYHPLQMALKRSLAQHTDVVDRIPTTVTSIKLPVAVVTSEEAEKKFLSVRRQEQWYS